MARRVLVFGVTGINKSAAIDRFSKWCPGHSVKSFDFESRFLFNRSKGGADAWDFLDSAQKLQRREWARQWNKLLGAVDSHASTHETDDIFVCLHGCFTRYGYAARPALDLNEVAKFKPTHIVTLWDDIYDMWWRIQKRANEQDFKGTPTLAQLLHARRVELLIADQVAYHSSPDEPVLNIALAVSHPKQTLWNWIYTDDYPKVVYLSFPITAPVELQQDKDDPSGVELVNDFIKYTYALQKEEHNHALVAICPLGIDELCFTYKTLQKDEKCRFTDASMSKLVGFGQEDDKTVVNFDRDRRWSQTFWPEEDRLTSGHPPLEDRKPFPWKQVRDASGMAYTDVAWRDYRMVEYSDYVVVFNPVFRRANKPPKLSRSVMEEIEFARGSKTPTYVYQESFEEKWSGSVVKSDTILKNKWSELQPPGTMAPYHKYLLRYRSYEECFDKILNI